MRFSKIISILLHPIFMPLIALKLTLFLVPSIGFSITAYLNFIIGVVIISTIILPIICIFLFLKTGKVTSLELSSYKERPTPLIYCTLFMYIGFLLINHILIFSPILKAVFLGGIIIIALAAFISRFWKISLHMLGIGGLSGTLIGLNFFYGGLSQFIIILILLSGVLGICRINEKAHNHAQVYIGFLLGASIEFMTIFFI